MGREERIDLWVHHGVNGYDVGQLDFFVILGTCVGLVEREALSVQSPVKLLTLWERGGHCDR